MIYKLVNFNNIEQVAKRHRYNIGDYLVYAYESTDSSSVNAYFVTGDERDLNNAYSFYKENLEKCFLPFKGIV